MWKFAVEKVKCFTFSLRMQEFDVAGSHKYCRDWLTVNVFLFFCSTCFSFQFKWTLLLSFSLSFSSKIAKSKSIFCSNYSPICGKKIIRAFILLHQQSELFFSIVSPAPTLPLPLCKCSYHRLFFSLTLTIKRKYSI